MENKELRAIYNALNGAQGVIEELGAYDSNCVNGFKFDFLKDVFYALNDACLAIHKDFDPFNLKRFKENDNAE